MSGAMTPEVPHAPLPDGLVEVERFGNKYRIAVWHSESDGDFLWLSESEAGDVFGLLARVREAGR